MTWIYEFFGQPKSWHYVGTFQEAFQCHFDSFAAHAQPTIGSFVIGCRPTLTCGAECPPFCPPRLARRIGWALPTDACLDAQRRWAVPTLHHNPGVHEFAVRS